MARAAMIVACCIAALVSSRARAEEPWKESEPRLMLPGNRTVQPGELIELRWTPADSVSELEILLSLDGGRHYAMCISPQLDPRRCTFLWRVPQVASSALRMRIRFNRGGREIEGAPTGPLFVGPDGARQGEPLGLPPVTPAEREGGSGGRGETPTGRSALRAIDAAEEEPPSLHRSSVSSALAASASEVRCPHAHQAAFAPPRVLPLRA